ILKIFGKDAARVFTTVGPEQEYFLIDKNFYYQRPDLIACGRTLFGAPQPKGQELEDQYFGTIPERVLACMADCEAELFKLGVHVKTRHNEVAPSQYEIAPIFENSNLATDHQNLIMELLRKTADKYGLVALLHEKPFAGINGSGKHNNWSMGTDTENLLEPGNTPHENAQFLVFCCAVIRAVAKHSKILRLDIATELEKATKGGKDLNSAIQALLPGIIKESKKVIFNGNNYSEEWHQEAEKRGLPNLKNTVEVLPVTIEPETIALFEKYKVYSDKELHSRFNILSEAYVKAVTIEGKTALMMAKTMI